MVRHVEEEQQEDCLDRVARRRLSDIFDALAISFFIISPDFLWLHRCERANVDTKVGVVLET